MLMVILNIAEKTLDYLNLSWEFSVSDCKVHLLDSEEKMRNNAKKPFGTINISSFSKESFSEKLESLESQLIKAKVINHFYYEYYRYCNERRK